MDKRWTSSEDARALVTGATGMVGSALLAELGGHAVATSRNASALRTIPGVSEAVPWDIVSTLPDRALDGVESVFHLAGEPVAEGRWTAEKKARILRSRIDSTRALVASIAGRPSSSRPRVLVCASAVGYYGSRGDEILDEACGPGEGFLADVCCAWEEEAARARDLGVRVVSARISLVLSLKGGALPRMLTPFRLGMGAKLGDGKQWMPWIHVADLVSLLRFAASTDSLEGPVNAAAPGLVRNADFTKDLAHALRRPALLTAPAMALRLAMGEAAGIVLASQRVVPDKAREAGFSFLLPELEGALANLLAPPERSTQAHAAGSAA